MTSRTIQLFDCTLRDGSYQVDFGFTAAHTHAFVQAIEETGVPLIEVGHGLGLGAERSGRAPSAETDESYMRAARMAARKARIGVFAMPAFAALDDMNRALDAGMDFVRFGVDAAVFERAAPYIRRAAEIGLSTTVFLMKTYTLPAADVRAAAPRFADWGASGVAVVDSAGGMTPADVRAYVKAASAGGLPVAFHGHDNLRLAVGNAIAAAEAGATVLDASLKGIGRSTGNAQIEALAGVLDRMNRSTGVDVRALAATAERLIRKEDFDGGVARVDLIQGLARVHSGMQSRIDDAAERHGLDPETLTFAAGEARGGLDLDDEALERLARTFSAAQRARRHAG